VNSESEVPSSRRWSLSGAISHKWRTRETAWSSRKCVPELPRELGPHAKSYRKGVYPFATVGLRVGTKADAGGGTNLLSRKKPRQKYMWGIPKPDRRRRSWF